LERTELEALLKSVRDGETPVTDALNSLSHWPTRELGHSRLDLQRASRCGQAEVVFGAGKTPQQLREIGRALLEHHPRLLVTRVSDEGAAALLDELPDAQHAAEARAVWVDREPREGEGLVLVLSAGTSDRPVAEEATLTARMMGARVEHLADVGVAGLHRLLHHAERLREARALVVVAGMEGALPSVVGGLVERPVVAVPTSVGYGASFGGLAALLGMLNSCAAGVTVVNIDNGFGGGYAAAMMNRVRTQA
jgi:NCAIR mutase (PurE)-related protein